ncbi:MAG: siderophore-interacting protein, partial [Telluria sp.]
MLHDAQAADHAPLVTRIRHELKLRDLVVSAVEPLGPGFVAVTLQGEALADFSSLGFDDHVKLMFGDAGEAQVRRDYTPRRFSREARTLTIEFALHGAGAASDWARKAQPGDRLLVGGPRGSMIVPLTLGWHLLVGDATALPAISRRLEELPEDCRAFVFVLADQADRRELASAARVEAHWAESNEALLAALAGLALPAADTGFAWGGGEASLMARVR